MKFHHCLFKILKTQNVADGWTNGRENSIPPPQTQFAGDIIIITIIKVYMNVEQIFSDISQA